MPFRHSTILLLLLATSAAAEEATEPPCLDAPERRQLDFWLGHWEVRAGGEKVGESRIEKSTGGCIVHESYVQADGYNGKSVNFYDPKLRSWRQTWVDASGNVSEFAGEYRDGAMRFEGETHTADGGAMLRRMTLLRLEDGRIRQVSERSTDGGASWAPFYDLEYVPLP